MVNFNKSTKGVKNTNNLWKNNLITLDMLKTSDRWTPITKKNIKINTEGKLLFDRVDNYIKKYY